MLPYRVSVVIPTRNRSALLAEAIQSVRAVDGPDLDLEIIVVDNGSTDDTEQVATSLGVRFLRSTTPGPGATRNVGLRAATGDYVAFLDDDDLWLPGHLRPQLALLDARPELVGCMGQIVPVDDLERPLADPYPASLPADGDVFSAFLSSFPQVGAFVLRTSVRDTVGYFNEHYVCGEDWDWFLRIALKHRIGHIAVPAMLFRSRPIATRSEDAMNRRRVWPSRRVFWHNVWRGRWRRLPPAWVIRQALRLDGIFAGYFLRSAAAHATAGERAAARQSLLRAMWISPLHVAWGVVRGPASFAWAVPVLLGRSTEPAGAGREHS